MTGEETGRPSAGELGRAGVERLTAALRGGRAADLDEAVDLLRRSVAATPDDSPGTTSTVRSC